MPDFLTTLLLLVAGGLLGALFAYPMGFVHGKKQLMDNIHQFGANLKQMAEQLKKETEKNERHDD